MAAAHGLSRADLAESVGFEPTVDLHPHLISNLAGGREGPQSDARVREFCGDDEAEGTSRTVEEAYREAGTRPEHDRRREVIAADELRTAAAAALGFLVAGDAVRAAEVLRRLLAP